MGGNLDYLIDRNVITKEFLLEIVPVSHKIWGGSEEIAFKNAEEAYIDFRYRVNERREQWLGSETDVEFMEKYCSDPKLKKLTINTIRSLYSSKQTKDGPEKVFKLKQAIDNCLLEL